MVDNGFWIEKGEVFGVSFDERWQSGATTDELNHVKQSPLILLI